MSNLSSLFPPATAPPTKESVKSADAGPPAIPPPKTDKPRPHGCTTCGRSFARLEHLKRHERSHTKEKPFECPDCARCFARRDLLLRHQQKLHMTTTPAARPRNGRRESTGGASTASTHRVRKNSIVGAQGTGTMRPRANTIGHVDGAALGLGATPLATTAPTPHGHAYHPSLGSAPVASHLDYRGFGAGGPGLAKLDTHGLSLDLGGGLRTAPVYGSVDGGLGELFMGHGSTVNPAQLHFGGSPPPPPFDTPTSPYGHGPAMAPPPPTDPMLEDEFSFDWLNGYDPAAPMGAPHESALDGSSPSAMSTGSQSGISEALLDGTARFPMPAASWHNPFPTGHHGFSGPGGGAAPVDFGAGSGGPGPDPLAGGAPPETVSPKSLMAQTHNPFAETYATPPSMTAVGPPLLGGHHAQSMFPSSMAPRGDSPNPRNLAFAHSALRAPHRSAPDTVTDATRQALLAGLAPPPAADGGAGGDDDPRLPRTADLQRYLTAYLTDFHPHLPFLHLPTLDFQAPEYTPRSGAGPASAGGSLLLAMAALGARFAGDAAAAQDLFAAAQTMIHGPLEEYHRAVVAPPPPLWLVQALLLTVLYSHTGDDPAAVDRARPHCATLVRLARALEHPGGAADDRPPDPSPAAAPGSDPPSAARRVWLAWTAGEARTRTLSALFVLSAFLVAAYHQAPALTNSEFRRDLPCDEALWAAESPQAWAQRGGAAAARADRVSFATALTTLLTASQRGVAAAAAAAPPPDDLRPSTFGCLVLIYALHNYIWETRQRHRGRPWTARETDAMQAHLEPALRAWQTAWAHHPTHSLEYPNPFGAGPLSADSIPLLDLAYVRLYVDLGRRRQTLWARDDATSLAVSPDAAGVEDVAPDALPTAVLDPSMRPADAGAGRLGLPPSPHERHLRRAAFYAADSIAMSQRLGTTFAASPCRDLPIQSALCAFDCAQVLVEWLATVEGRALTPELGLEEEDRTLVATIGTILARIDAQGSGYPRVAGGYGPQILVATAGLLERTGVWPVTGRMARSLEAQARRLQGRPLSSLD